MRVVFVSNFYNHHQRPFSREMYRQTDGSYRFISTEAIPKERLDLGWREPQDPFVLHFDEKPEYCCELIDSAEAVIFGSAPQTLMKNRLKNGKLIFKYSERLYKKAPNRWRLLLRRIREGLHRQRRERVFLLCASAYAAQDYALTGSFIGKAYKWGYFPEVKRYADIEALFAAKAQNDPPLILWAGRFLDWKHPDAALRVAKRLRDNGLHFEMCIIGCGEMEPAVRELLAADALEAQVHLLGAKTPEEVRQYMERANIYLLTSDRNEGWGAVLNEALNSGCAVVANREIGSVPYLLEHGKNGLIYTTEEELYRCVEQLVLEPARREALGHHAYQTVSELWNAEVAATRFCEALPCFQTTNALDAYPDGPLAKE